MIVMALEIGSILEGKVTGITKFGAFVSLPEGKSGLVHISEVAATYVTDVHEHLQIGQAVKVKILSISDDGKINLSIKRALPRPQNTARPREAQSSYRPAASRPAASFQKASPAMGEVLPPSGDRAFEDKLKAFMSESDNKIASSGQYEHKTRSRRR